MMEYLILKVEGFDQQRLLSQCLQKKIRLRRVRMKSDLEMTLMLSQDDWETFQRLTRNKYQVTIMKRKGIRPLFKAVFHKKSTWLGLALLIFLLYYQGLFISEIRIYGYERLTEEQLRAELKEAGLYEGARKSLDPDRVEIEMFKKHDDISWIGVKYIGNLAEVQIVEKQVIPPMEDESYPCHVVAEKEGYIQKVIPREGLQAVDQDTFVKPGDIVITGMMPLRDTTYSSDPEHPGYRYVHADGDVFAKIIYRFVFYQEAKQLKKTATGRWMPGIAFTLGDLSFDSRRLFYPYESAVSIKKDLVDQTVPFPIKLSFTKTEEVTLSARERSNKEIQAEAKAQIRLAVKENLPENAQILNNSLKFSAEENIIVMTVIVEALEEIGMDQAIIEPPPETENSTGQTDGQD